MDRSGSRSVARAWSKTTRACCRTRATQRARSARWIALGVGQPLGIGRRPTQRVARLEPVLEDQRSWILGRGDAVGSNEYLRHSASSSDVIEPLHAVKLESHSADEAKWEVPRETGEKFDLKIPFESYVIKCVMVWHVISRQRARDHGARFQRAAGVGDGGRRPDLDLQRPRSG